MVRSWRGVEPGPGIWFGAVHEPAWMKPAERLLDEAMGRIRLLGAVTPIEASRERARLISAFERGDAARPEWRYVSVAHDDLRRALDALVFEIEAAEGPSGGALGRVYAARARELAEEAALAAQAGSASLGALARGRFAPGEDAREASRLARGWLAADRVASPPREFVSDAALGTSLFGRMKEAVGRLRLPFTVVAEPSLASLAATGERTILVATGRPVSEEDIARTVLHEIEAHARPRARAQQLLPKIFRIGTARGTDEQEGLALVLEERHGFLQGERRRELGLRHAAVEAMRAGASFVEGVRALIRDHGTAARQAVLVAERAYRGGDGESAGLGREIVYVESFLRVRRALAATPGDEHVLASGQVATAALSALRPYLSELQQPTVG